MRTAPRTVRRLDVTEVIMRLKVLFTALAGALLLAPAQAAAQELVRVHGTLQWGDAPFAPTHGIVFGLLATPESPPWGEPIPVVISGNQASYEGYAFAGSELFLNATVCDGSEPFCSIFPGSPSTQAVTLFQSGVSVATEDLQLDFTLPADYTFEPVSGSAELTSGGTLQSGQALLTSVLWPPEGYPPLAFHQVVVPVQIVDATHATYEAQLGVGIVPTHAVEFQVEECPPPPAVVYDSYLYEVIAGQSLTLPQLLLSDPRGTCPPSLSVTIEPVSSGPEAAVGAMYSVKAVVQNITDQPIYDADLHFDIQGPARPRVWTASGVGTCGATGYTEATDTSTVDCDIGYLEAGGAFEFAGTVDIGALQQGVLNITATAAIPNSNPAVDGITVTATESTGNDLRVLGLHPGGTFYVGVEQTVAFRVLNAGSHPVDSAEVRFSSDAPATWNPEPNTTYAAYRDLVTLASSYDVQCQPEPSSGDLVCLLSGIEAWTEVILAVNVAPGAAGAILLQAGVLPEGGDPDPSNNTVSVTEQVMAAQETDLSSTLSALTALPKAGEPLLLEWRLHNAGPGTAAPYAVLVTDPIIAYPDPHPMVTVVSAPEGFWCAPFNERTDAGWVQQAYCVGTLAPGETAVVHVEVLTESGGDFGAYAVVVPDTFSFFTHDPDPSNDASALVTPITGPIPTLWDGRIGTIFTRPVPCMRGVGTFIFLGSAKYIGAPQPRFDGGVLWRTIGTAEEGFGYVSNDEAGGFFPIKLELESGRVRSSVKTKETPRTGSLESGKSYEDFTFVVTDPSSSSVPLGTTVRWRLTWGWEVDELGRVFETVNDIDVMCK